MIPHDDRGKPDLSILIVNYNVKDYLVQCLRSIASSKGTLNVQVVVVDNASTDHSVATLRPQFPDVTWVALNENIGFGRGNNAGLPHCTGRYILFLNPDTILRPDTLQTMVRYLDDHPEVGLAGCKVLNPDGTFQLACRRGLPTPWASFTKLFGLQSLFPTSRLFARYNLTYLPVDDTYDVDALIGAFMMGPRSVIESSGGFDPAFFMYGEDLDLCYRIQRQGHAIRYVHTTSIVHYKGESTKRSSMDEVRVFYQAMAIFARKHFGRSTVLLAFLRLGIVIRSFVERIRRRSREIAIATVDLMCILLALLAATSVRFDGPFGFPDYAYPLVLFVVPLVALLSLVSVGEYVEYRPTVRRSMVGLLVTFFVLSSLTYFFKEYAFSRGVLLMTIGFSAVLLTIVRGVVAFYDTMVGARKPRSILIVGATEAARNIIDELHRAERRNAVIVGIVSVGSLLESSFAGYPVVGSADYLEKIIDDTGAEEVIVADPAISQGDAISMMQRTSRRRVRFHLALAYDDIVMARIVNDVAGIEPTVQVSPLLRFRNRTVKRLGDLAASSVMLVVLMIPVFLQIRGARQYFSVWLDVFRGVQSVVGLSSDGIQRQAGKPGIVSLADLGGGSTLGASAIAHLNTYYVDAYTLALDVEIMLKYLVRRRGNKHHNA